MGILKIHRRSADWNEKVNRSNVFEFIPEAEFVADRMVKLSGQEKRDRTLDKLKAIEEYAKEQAGEKREQPPGLVSQVETLRKMQANKQASRDLNPFNRKRTVA